MIPSADPAARPVLRDVFFEYFGNTAEMLSDEYGYEPSSVYLCVLDRLRGRPRGRCG